MAKIEAPIEVVAADQAPLLCSVMGDLRAAVGGPRSLRFEPALLIAGLAYLIGKLRALTRRGDDFFDQMEEVYQAAHRVELAAPRPMPGQDGATRVDVSNYLSMTFAEPRPYPRPTNIVLTCCVSMLCQLLKSSGQNIKAARPDLDAGFESVFQNDVDAFAAARAAALAGKS